MAKKADTVRYTADETAAKLARGESRADWARVDAMSRDKIERPADNDDGALPAGWEGVVLDLPVRKAAIHIRLDADVVDWFKARGKGYQTRINAVLRAFVETRRRGATDPQSRVVAQMADNRNYDEQSKRGSLRPSRYDHLAIDRKVYPMTARVPLPWQTKERSPMSDRKTANGGNSRREA